MCSKTCPIEMEGHSGTDGTLCICGRQLDMLCVYVSPTTGGQFQLRVASTDSVDFLRKLVSKRLRVPKERICLLHRDRHLREGTLIENSILDGARITLLPSVETGLLTQRPEQSVMQALESLNDNQVNDFLTGKAPLNLTMRLGDHMMLIQLQLSTVSPLGVAQTKSRIPTTHSQAAHTHTHTQPSHSHQDDPHPSTQPPLTPPSTPGRMSASDVCPGYTHGLYTPPQVVPPPHVTQTGRPPPKLTLNPSQSSPSIVSKTSSSSSSSSSSSCPSAMAWAQTGPSSPTDLPPQHHNHLPSIHSSSLKISDKSSPSSTSGPPSCLGPTTPPHHHHLHVNRHHCHSPGSSSSPATPSTSPSSAVGSPHTGPGVGLSWDSDLPVRGCPHSEGDTDPHASLDTKALADASRNLTQTLKQLSSEVLTSKPEPKEENLISQDLPRTDTLRPKSSERNSNQKRKSSSSSSNSSTYSDSSGNNYAGATSSSLDHSSRAVSGADGSSAETATVNYTNTKNQGAIIESMHHHGKGVYSGTFSGTLNPALQDRHGRPKRDISTIIHILNDLLCATPQYRRHSGSISLSTTPPTPSSTPTTSAKSRPFSSNTAEQGTTSTPELSHGARKSPMLTTKHKYKESTGTQNDIDENIAMRNKLEEIRNKLEQRRARRKARREQRSSPYSCTTSWSSETTSIPNCIATKAGTHDSGSPSGSSSTPMEVGGGADTAEQQDQAHLCQLNETVVV